MKGDFSRFTFDPTKHYTQVLLQQGRVQLDADWNEQQAIAQYRNEAIAQDVIGVTGVPKVNGGFQIGLAADGRDLTLSPGHYYVDGILCELEVPTTYSSQPDFAAPLPTASGRYVVYLDVWQQHISAIEDPQIRETALGGVDTATRSQIVWQVKLNRLGNVGTGTCADWQPPAASSGKLTASVDQSDATPQPCILPPASGYRGLENQCYRVEVHDDGSADAAGTRFKWSRDNGAVMTAIEKVSAQTVTVRDLGQDDSRSFRRDQWVEVLFDRLERIDRRGTLTQINADIQPERRELTLAAVPAGLEKQAGESEENYRDRLQSRGYHARLRRWDGTGAITTAEIDLEQGIKIRFSPGTYQAGDYWMIPARTATSATTGDIEWPRQADNSPIAKLPDGIRHHYSPIATVDFDGTVFQTVVDCRRFFPALSAIAAEDVSFTNDTCGTEFNTAKTVKDAIGLLCRSQIGACTFVLSPSNWQTLLPQISTLR